MMNEITKYQNIANALFVAGIFLIFLAIFFFFQFRIISVIDRITGRGAKKEKEKFKKDAKEKKHTGYTASTKNENLQEEESQNEDDYGGELSQEIYDEKTGLLITHSNTEDSINQTISSAYKPSTDTAEQEQKKENETESEELLKQELGREKKKKMKNRFETSESRAKEGLLDAINRGMDEEIDEDDMDTTPVEYEYDETGLLANKTFDETGVLKEKDVNEKERKFEIIQKIIVGGGVII